MLTFEKVLEVFQAYLDDDPLYEVVQTSHGYTLMAWEPHRNDWYSVTFNPSLLTSPKRKKQVAEILTEAEKYIWRIKEEMRCA